VGDFNYPDISWTDLVGDTTCSNLFCELVFDSNLTQLVDVPTHVRGNILDLVLTNEVDAIKVLKVHSTQETLTTL